MELFDDKPDYVRLDDDVSFQIMRTNPKLTTNVKLLYDGKNLYMDSYSANPLLSSNNYKNYKVLKTGLYNDDLKRFLLGSSSSAYEVGQNMENTIVGDSFDNQFENIYWSGCESINSSVYPQSMGFVAPIYLRKKRPNYFVIFKIDNPANTNLVSGREDRAFDFKSDILGGARIVKSFNLKPGTVIGDYIDRYVGQKDFRYDRSLYVNFTAKEIYYYGIDKSTGILCQKVNNISETLLENDITISRSDDWITSGYERNDMIFPYIMNLEFLFDDNETDEYKFVRYFGMYCNNIDLYEYEIQEFIKPVKINGKILNTAINLDKFNMDSGSFYYAKSKYGDIFTVDEKMRIIGDINQDDFTGFEPVTISSYGEKVSGTQTATMMIKIDKPLLKGDKVMLYDIFNSTETDIVHKIFTATDTDKLKAGRYSTTKFSCLGTVSDNAKAIAGIIREYGSDNKWIIAFSIGDVVVIRSAIPGSKMNGMLKIRTRGTMSVMNSFNMTVDSNGWVDCFMGGTNYDGSLLKILKDDMNIFTPNRYLKSYNGKKNSRIMSVMPYINDNDVIDEKYCVVSLDDNGRYVNLSRTKQVEIMDIYYTRFGILSLFPVKDFDFDTVDSVYGENSMIKDEISKMDEYLENKNEKIYVTVGIETDDTYNEDFENEDLWDIKIDDIDPDEVVYVNSTTNLPYYRFVSNTGDAIDTEYDYFCENVLPELSTVNKTVPFISKWGYMDEGKDSCENPYRLNTSKIFDTCNFSSNTFMQDCDIFEYTHSMPYYMVNWTVGEDDDQNRAYNEFQYVNIPEKLKNKYYNEIYDAIDEWVSYFSSDSYNRFDEMFGDVSGNPESSFRNKRFNRKYSRFLLGNDKSKASTLFRGVKFEITDVKNGNETYGSKYNGYKFTFLYIPVNLLNTESLNRNEDIDSDTVIDKNTGNIADFKIKFIRNDKFKFIVGMVFFDSLSKYIDNEMNNFNKMYLYGGCLGFNIYRNNNK